MSPPVRAVGRLMQRIQRHVARRAAPDLERELRETRRQLRLTRARLKDARSELREARDQLSLPAGALPPEVERTIEAVRAERLTYLKAGMLRDLAGIVIDLEQSAVPGMIVEAGTARGGSAIVIAAAKSSERPMKVYDVFGLIPAPTKEDGPDVHRRYAKIVAGDAQGPGGDVYYGYRDDLYHEVKDAFARHGVAVGEHRIDLVRGLFEDTIRLDEPVAFAHLDGDWYESTMTCLTRIAPVLVRGGRIVIDDYYAWSGCRRAVDEYFAGRDGFRLERRTKLHVVRD